MTTYARRALTALVCAGAATALTACSALSSGSGSSDSAPSVVPAPSTPAAAAGPDGLKLASWLLPASAIPKSLKLEASSARNTGTDAQPPSAAPVPKSAACQDLTQSDWVTAAGIGGVHFAQNDYIDKGGDMFAQELDSFSGQDASKVMAGLHKVLTECAAFPYKVSGITAKEHVKLKPLAGVGDEALEAVISSPELTGGTTVVAVRVGSVVVTTMYNEQAGVGAKGVTLTRELVKRVQPAA